MSAAPMTLRWEEQPSGGTYGYSGAYVAAIVVRIGHGRTTNRWSYSVQAPTKWICKGHGEVASQSAARRAADRAWSKWLDHAGLSARLQVPA